MRDSVFLLVAFFLKQIIVLKTLWCYSLSGGFGCSCQMVNTWCRTPERRMLKIYEHIEISQDHAQLQEADSDWLQMPIIQPTVFQLFSQTLDSVRFNMFIGHDIVLVILFSKFDAIFRLEGASRNTSPDDFWPKWMVTSQSQVQVLTPPKGRKMATSDSPVFGW